ncbi:MAG: 3-hydroxyacyl-CoA dehydrogenase family protein [Candidatus Hydrogenedentes bacterium]|nr:3-hydroxyacyl-CoA dehydrogenase family protein [Candidatus Hydrogenedentota bacterium]
MDVNELKVVAVIGAGDMGHGIAESALLAGFRVCLRDVTPELAARGAARIWESLRKFVEKGRIRQEHHDLIRHELLSVTADLGEAVRGADLVIEAVPELMDLKKKLFRELDTLAPPHAILASNTSTMSITEIAGATGRPGQVVGLHYFNPAVLMPTVEVIRSAHTSEETMEAAFGFCVKCGKKPVRVNKDVPGFIVNRVQAPGAVLLRCILDAGVIPPEAVDAVMRGLGMPMGPFEVMDYTGLDVNVNAANYFAETVHPDYAPGRVLLELVAAGHLGKKTGRGIFDWSGGRPKIDLSLNAEGFSPVDLAAVAANEAAKLIEMGVADAETIDRAVVGGMGFAIGPIAAVQGFGPADLAARLENLAAVHGREIFQPCDTIRAGGYKTA